MNSFKVPHQNCVRQRRKNLIFFLENSPCLTLPRFINFGDTGCMKKHPRVPLCLFPRFFFDFVRWPRNKIYFIELQKDYFVRFAEGHVWDFRVMGKRQTQKKPNSGNRQKKFMEMFIFHTQSGCISPKLVEFFTIEAIEAFCQKIQFWTQFWWSALKSKKKKNYIPFADKFKFQIWVCFKSFLIALAPKSPILFLQRSNCFTLEFGSAFEKGKISLFCNIIRSQNKMLNLCICQYIS